jgi:hypothetical protein
MDSMLLMSCHAMRKGEIFTAVYDIRNILTEIFSLLGVERGERRLVMHANNARPHPAKMTRAFVMPDSCELYDIHIRRTWLFLTFSGFLFGHFKNRLQGQQFRSAYEFLSRIRKILDEISVDTLEVAFQAWINRLDRWIAVLLQMESTWNEVNNGALKKMLISAQIWKCSSHRTPQHARGKGAHETRYLPLPWKIVRISLFSSSPSLTTMLCKFCFKTSNK